MLFVDDVPGKPISANNKISKIFVLFAKSVPVADAIIEISRINNISCEIFIVPPPQQKYIYFDVF